METPDTVLLIIKRWLEIEADVYLSVSSVNISVWAKCRVTAVEGNKAVFRSGGTIVAFVVEDGFSFKYKELREVSGLPGFESIPEDKLLNAALTATLASPVGRGDLLQVVLIET